MAQYKPSLPFSTALLLLIPTYKKISGVKKKTFPEEKDGILFYGSFKTYGGTEIDINGIHSVEDTANIETWYRPDITSGCRIAIAGSNDIYEILGKPENIEKRNQYLKFKARCVKGGA